MIDVYEPKKHKIDLGNSTGFIIFLDTPIRADLFFCPFDIALRCFAKVTNFVPHLSVKPGHDDGVKISPLQVGCTSPLNESRKLKVERFLVNINKY